MDQHRNRSIQIAGAPGLGDQKPEQHPKRCRALLRCRPPACPTALHDELAQIAGIPSGRLVTHSFEQLADVDPVIRQRAFAGPALLLHPSAEADKQRRKRGDAIVTMVGNETRIREVTQEEASAAENVHPKRVTEWTASVRGALSSSPNMNDQNRRESAQSVRRGLCRLGSPSGSDAQPIGDVGER